MECRLCQSPTVFKFNVRILGDTDVGYHECKGCHALQTDEPTWLHRAYSEEFHSLGAGAAQRTVWCQALLFYLSNTLGIRGRHLDFGGGCGLLVRLMRDLGWESFLDDKFSTNVYAKGFLGTLPGDYKIVTAFEVFEHLAKPAVDIEPLFTTDAEMVVVSTLRYRGQGSDWFYLLPFFGQHVFFWSDAAHQFVAKKYGYYTMPLGDKYTLYTRKKPGLLRRQFAHTSRTGTKLAQCALLFRSRPGLQDLSLG